MDDIVINILKEVREGNGKYYSKLMDIYNPYLYKLARYYLNTSYNKIDDVEDAVQEVWIKIFKYVDILDDLNKFKSWISRIMKNHCINMQKKNITHVERHITIDLDTRHDLLQKIEDNNFNSDYESIEIIKSILKTLPEIYYEPLRLFYIERLKISEISEIMDVSVSALKWRLFKGRDMLRLKVLKEINRE